MKNQTVSVFKKNFVLGLTGKSAAGKNAAASIFETMGWVHFDTDKMVHEILNEKAKEVAALFGNEILTATGIVNRQRLGQLVFGNPERMGQLENLIYPILEEKIRQRIANGSGREGFVVNGANLFASPSICSLCHEFLIIKAPFLVRLWRAYHRDKKSFFSIVRRFWHQEFFSIQDFSLKADIQTISNTSTKQRLEKKLLRFVAKKDLIDGISKRKSTR